MICPTCHGAGRIEATYQLSTLIDGISRRSNYVLAPCPDCIGGIASCCDAAGSARLNPLPPLVREETTGKWRRADAG